MCNVLEKNAFLFTYKLNAASLQVILIITVFVFNYFQLHNVKLHKYLDV